MTMKTTPLATKIGGAEEGSSIPIQQTGDPLKASLYFHIPFCTRKCDYCHFYVIPDKPSFQIKYMEALKQEWELRGHGVTPLSIYFGGGTPSLLGAKNIAEILSWIGPLPKETEVTLETNPENPIDPDYALIGINRISIGVQSFDDRELITLSRTHNSSKAEEAVLRAKEASINNISIDLMVDLPNQSIRSWERTLEKAISLPITHLSLYNLTIEPHTAFYKHREKLAERLPNESTSLSFLDRATEKLKGAGFSRYEISAFCKNNLISNHNIGYWTDRPFLGFGPSAFSYVNGTRYRNRANLNRYAESLKNGELPVDFSETLPNTARLKESLSLGLRVLAGVDLPRFEKKWGKLPKETWHSLKKLHSLNLIHLKNHQIALTERGTLFYDSVAEELIEGVA